MNTEELRQRLVTDTFRWTRHAVQEASEDRLLIGDVERALRREAQVIEDYPDASRGACCLVLTRLADGSPVHAVVGYAQADVLAIITVYRPDPSRWSEDFTERRERP